MPHTLIVSLSKITPLLITLCDDSLVDQLLEKRCKEYKDRLLQFRVAFDSQFDSRTDRALFDISLRGLRVSEIFYTYGRKNRSVAKQLHISKKSRNFRKIVYRGPDTKYSVALREQFASEKKQSSTTFPEVSKQKSPTEYNIFIIIHGLLQGDVMLLDEFLCNHPEVAGFLEKNMSLLADAFCAWEQAISFGSYNKIGATIASDQWLNALTLAANEVGSLIWYYNQMITAREQSKNVENGTTKLEENILESSNIKNIDTVYPFLLSKDLSLTKVQLDYLRYGCAILIKCFPINRLYAVEKLVIELKQVDEISAENISKLFDFYVMLGKLPECNVQEVYRNQIQEVINKFKSASDCTPTSSRQCSQECPLDEGESTSPVMLSAAAKPIVEVKIKEKDSDEIKAKEDEESLSEPSVRKRTRVLNLPEASSSEENKKQRSKSAEVVHTSTASNQSQSMGRLQLLKTGGNSTLDHLLVARAKRKLNNTSSSTSVAKSELSDHSNDLIL
jgi:hypothetical protein